MKKILEKISFNSPVILIFAILSAISLLLGQMTGGASTYKFFSVYRSSMSNPLFYVRLLAHVLGHANLAHYFNNMMMMFLVGPIVEERYGSKKLLGMIVATAIITGVLNILLFPHTSLCGASGIVFMLIILSSAVSIKEDKLPLTMIIVILLYLGQQVYGGLFSKDNISQFTHIVGGICGVIFGITNKDKSSDSAEY